MATEGTGEGAGTGAGTGQAAPAWVAQLPADLKDNAAFTSYKTIGDLAKAHLEMGEKVKESDGLKAKLKDAIPKLPENATQEERDMHAMALGRPEKPDEYEFAGDGKDAPEWTTSWKQDLFKLGIPKETAKALSGLLSTKIQAMVDSHNAGIQKEIETAGVQLKAEWGDKYDANVALATRLWKAHTDGELDKDFRAETSKTRASIVRYIVKMAAKTGEDTSLPGVGQRAPAPAGGRMAYDKSNMPPART
jgi:hypothetical protein